MALELTMPALSPTMEKGTLARWLVRPGDIIKAGDMIAEIETDKATMELEADEDGQIAELLIEDGAADVPVGSVIARINQGGEQVGEVPVAAIVEPVVPSPVAPSTPEPSTDAEAVLPAPAVQPIHAEGVLASPLARRIAAIEGLSLEAIKGSGPQGKVLKADLDSSKAMSRGTQGAAGQTPPQSIRLEPNILPPPEGVPVETIKLTTMRKTIARRLTESKQQVPHFYLTARCRLDPLLALRTSLNEELAGRGQKLSVNDLLLKAMALALKLVPEANVQFGGDVLHRFERVDISLAVAIDGGLITPVLKGVESLSLSALAEQSRELAAKARAGSLQPSEYQGGTASLSNLGMFGIDEMFPVLNPPQALILGIGAAIEQPWSVDGKVALANVMAATGSFDHRAIDGAVAARFMATFRELVEAPFRLLC